MIRIQDIEVGYDNTTVLKNVTLEFSKGKIYGIIGPNGSGKSTLLKAINGEVDYSKGSITIDGKEKRHYRPIEYAQKLSYMRQSPLTKFPFKVEEIISMGRYSYHRGKPKRNDRKVVDHYIQLNELEHLRNKTINHLSGGEFQRVIFAKTLSQESEILLIDEGMSNADLNYKIQFMKHLKLEAEKDKVVICVLHDLNLARKFCDHLIVLHEQKILREGEAHKALNEDVLKTVFKVDGYFQNDSLIIN